MQEHIHYIAFRCLPVDELATPQHPNHSYLWSIVQILGFQHYEMRCRADTIFEEDVIDLTAIPHISRTF